jgi:[acyl-carrier-protein] S-malonyltransferase
VPPPEPEAGADVGVRIVAAASASAVACRAVRGADLRARIGTASFAFKGYDVTNLGRSAELLAHPAYGPVVRGRLDEASAISADALHRPFDLAARVAARAPSGLDSFAEDVAMIVAVELAQLDLLEKFFGVDVRGARQSFGYSVGEMAAVVSGGVFALEQILPVPLDCAGDCAALAHDATLGVLFTRGPALALKEVQELCTAVSSEGRGMVGVSTYLSPNTVLVIGQGDTLDRLEAAMPGALPVRTMLRRKPHKIPPLHTPLVWQKNIPNRAAVALYKIASAAAPPTPRILSCATGAASYDPVNARDTLIRWVDQPQRLWDVITETLVAGVDLVIHVGPGPNLIPATFERLANNVAKQLGNRYLQMIGRGVGSRMNRYAWLARLLPSKAALLRAPHVEHVILEDWLLDQEVA